jgi:hypothetical protein
MRSKNILWLGVLFVLLLTVFCIAKYLNNFNPNVKTVATPSSEVIAHGFELEPVQISDALRDEQTNNEVDDSYLTIVKLVEQEEKDIENAYNKALDEEKQKSSQKVKVKKSLKTKKVIHKNQPRIKRKVSSRKHKRLLIETILENQTLVAFGKLSSLEKQKLKKIVTNFQKNPSCFLRIEADKKNNKFYSTKRYLAKLGIPKKDIQVLHKRDKKAISISYSNHSEIEISVIKKD